MKNRFLALIAALLFCIGFGSAGAHAHAAVLVSAQAVAMFDTESVAHVHCPSDEVVWLNTRTGVYHEKGMRWYGRTRHGAFVCRKEADGAGYRDTRNGQ